MYKPVLEDVRGKNDEGSRQKDIFKIGSNLLFFFACTIAQAEAKPQPLPPLLEEVAKNYSKSVTISADFSQLNENSTTGLKKSSSGKIFVKRPSKIRWETKKPDTNLLVGDGKRYWFYTPPFEEGERGQVIEKDSSGVQTQLANALLAGEFNTRNMTVQQKSKTQFVLTPKAGTAGTVTRAMVEIDPQNKVIQKVTLDHKGGNHTEIILSAVELGQNIKEDFFKFTPPPNTDRVTE